MRFYRRIFSLLVILSYFIYYMENYMDNYMEKHRRKPEEIEYCNNTYNIIAL